MNCTFVKGTLEVVANFTIAKGKHIRVLIHLQSPHEPQPSKVLVVQVKSEPVSDEIDTICPQAMSGTALSATVSGKFLSASLLESSTVQVCLHMFRIHRIQVFCAISSFICKFRAQSVSNGKYIVLAQFYFHEDNCNTLQNI